MRSRQTPRGSMAQSEASSDDEDALSPKPKTPGGEERLEAMIQNDIRTGGDEAELSGNKTMDTPIILKTSP